MTTDPNLLRGIRAMTHRYYDYEDDLVSPETTEEHRKAFLQWIKDHPISEEEAKKLGMKFFTIRIPDGEDPLTQAQ